jgi:hypothetical protein
LLPGSIEVCGGSHFSFIFRDLVSTLAYEKSVARIDRPLAAAAYLGLCRPGEFLPRLNVVTAGVVRFRV